MRIAYLLTQSLESPSGLGRFGPLARQLAVRGHQVEIHALHPDFDSLEERQWTEDGVLVRYAAPMHVLKRGSDKTYYPVRKLLPLLMNATVSLGRAALSSEAEVIHICKPHPMNSLAGVAAGLLKGKAVFLDCDDYEAGSGRFSDRWQRWAVALFEKWTPRRARAVTTNTRYMAGRLVGWGVPKNKVFYIPNGVERERFTRPDKDRLEDLRSELQLVGKKVVVYVGSLSLASHPVDLLLEAFRRAADEIPEARLALVGGGEDYLSLRETAASLGLAEKVVFCGRVEPQEVPYYYALGQVSVDPVHDNPAAQGRSPLKLFESWASKTPFITADVGDRRSLMGTPPAGCLVKPGDPQALADGITSVLTDRLLQGRLRELGSRRVEDFYWDRLAVRMESVYHQAASKGKKGGG
jgi:glycosyltransferase involved in cell wall biosynthesis